MSEENNNTPTATEPEQTPAPAAIDDLPTISPVEATAGTPEPETEDNAEYALTLDPAHKITESVSQLMTDQAREQGLPSHAASAFINNILTHISESEKKARMEAIGALRKEWGSDYDKRVKSTIAFTEKVGTAVGLTQADADFLSSPSGYRLMYGLSKMFREPAAISGGEASPAKSAEQKKAEAEDMRTNPSNPYYNLLNDVNLPRSQRVPAWRRYNELRGVQIYPEH